MFFGGLGAVFVLLTQCADRFLKANTEDPSHSRRLSEVGLATSDLHALDVVLRTARGCRQRLSYVFQAFHLAGCGSPFPPIALNRRINGCDGLLRGGEGVS